MFFNCRYTTLGGGVDVLTLTEKFESLVTIVKL